MGIVPSHAGAFSIAQSLQAIGRDSLLLRLSDTSLQAFAFMSRELGRFMSMLTQVWRQMWLAHSLLFKVFRRTLRDLPVVLGQLFGSAARETLEHNVQINKTRQELAYLRAAPPPQPRLGVTWRYPSWAQPVEHTGATYRNQPGQRDRPAQYSRACGHPTNHASRVRGSGHRPPPQ